MLDGKIKMFPVMHLIAILTISSGAEMITVKDTVDYTNDIYTGKMARLYIGERFIDSIETGFGIRPVGKDSILYMKVETLNTPTVKGTYFTGLMLLHGKKTIDITGSLPMYNSHFSSPSVIDSSLYYWGLGEKDIFAVKMNFRKNRIDSVLINVTGSVITDSPDYFNPPEKSDDGILYEISDSRAYLVNRDMRSVKEIKPLKK